VSAFALALAGDIIISLMAQKSDYAAIEEDLRHLAQQGLPHARELGDQPRGPVTRFSSCQSLPSPAAVSSRSR
jgi:hypothetical protein